MKLKPADVTILVDSREKLPYIPELENMGFPCKVSGLTVGDYTAKHLESLICVERKELNDFIACVSWQHDRFEREILKIRGFRYKLVVIESSISAIIAHQYRSQTHINSVLGAIASWSRNGIGFVFSDNRNGGAIITGRFILQVANEVFSYARGVYSGNEKHCRGCS